MSTLPAGTESAPNFVVFVQSSLRVSARAITAPDVILMSGPAIENLPATSLSYGAMAPRIVFAKSAFAHLAYLVKPPVNEGLLLVIWGRLRMTLAPRRGRSPKPPAAAAADKERLNDKIARISHENFCDLGLAPGMEAVDEDLSPAVSRADVCGGLECSYMPADVPGGAIVTRTGRDRIRPRSSGRLAAR
jgi:hypothetical protein